MLNLNLEKHYALTSSAFVKEIVNPILSMIGISYFNYIKIYNDDCSRELLTNNPEWIDHFYKNGLFNSVGAIDVEHLLPKGYFLWSELNGNDPAYIQGRDFFNIDNGISFIIKRNDVTYLYIFASDTSHNQINNFYAANIDLLIRFIHYFNDNGNELIRNSEKHRIYLPTKQSINTDRSNNIVLSEKIRAEFLDKTKVNRYFLLNESDNLYLTVKQAELARLITKGYTSKQIAKRMDVSYRTVEGYCLALKNRLQESLSRDLNKSDLIHILRQSNIN